MTDTACRFCGDRIPGHAPLARSVQCCSKSRCRAAATNPLVSTDPTPGSDPTPARCWICNVAPKTDGTALCGKCRPTFRAHRPAPTAGDDGPDAHRSADGGVPEPVGVAAADIDSSSGEYRPCNELTEWLVEAGRIGP